MGRPKGSKNKAKVAADNTVQSTEVAPTVADDVPELSLNIKPKARKGYVPDPFWVLTKTERGTPIAIVNVYGKDNHCYFMVIPHYKERSSKTTVDSKSVIRPEFDNPEVEKEFADIKFYVAPVVTKPVISETITQSLDTVTESPEAATSSPDSTT